MTTCWHSSLINFAGGCSICANANQRETVYMSDVKHERSARINMRVSEDIKLRLDSLAQLYGLAPSTLAAMALSQFVIKEEQNQKMYVNVSESVNARTQDMMEFIKERMPALFEKE